MLKIERVFYEGKNVGEIVNNAIYLSRRKQSKHLFRGGKKSVAQAIKDNTACWGISNGIIEQLKLKNIDIVCVKDEETQIVYWTSLEKIANGKVLQIQKDMQKFLELSKWNIVKNFDELLNAVLRIKQGA